MWTGQSAVILIVLLVTASNAWAQRGVSGHRGFGGYSFGRGGFIPAHGGFVGRIGFGRGFARGGHVRIGGFHAGFGGWYGRSPWSAGVWWPALYAPTYPYIPPYGYNAYSPSAPPVTVITIPPPRPELAPPVRYSPPPEPESPRTPRSTNASPVYLVATRDGIVWAARAYWVEDGTLQLFTVRDERKSIKREEIDLALTDQFNRERGVEFRMP
jgi:hypothetical protein